MVTAVPLSLCQLLSQFAFLLHDQNQFEEKRACFSLQIIVCPLEKSGQNFKAKTGEPITVAMTMIEFC